MSLATNLERPSPRGNGGNHAKRKLTYIVKDRRPLVLAAHETVQQVCRCMWERRASSVLAVRTLAEGKDSAVATLAQAMTPNLVTITPAQSTRCGP